MACRTILLRSSADQLDPCCDRNKEYSGTQAGPAAGNHSLSLTTADGAPRTARRAARFLLLTAGPVAFPMGVASPAG